MRIIFLSIGVVLSLTITASFLITSWEGVYYTSAMEKRLPGRIVLGATEELNALTDMSGLERKNTFPENNSRTLVPITNDSVKNLTLDAKSGVAIDAVTEQELFAQVGDEICPIASITKLITALVFLENNPGWNNIYEITWDDFVSGGKIYLFRGDKVRLKDLFYLSLVASDNSATLALVKSTGLDTTSFVNKMNALVRGLGAVNTNFVDPIGLSDNNVSTGNEIARLAKVAFSREEISAATMSKKYEFETLGGRKKSVNNTDSLLEIFPQNGIKILGGKTGYTAMAGYCFAGKFTDANGREIISVVLGGKDIDTRFQETKKLVDWVFGNLNGSY